jgi:hypothetical protein
VDPEVPRPEEDTEVADVEDVRQAEAAGERDARGETGERGPEPASGQQTAQIKLLNGSAAPIDVAARVGVPERYRVKSIVVFVCRR